MTGNVNIKNNIQIINSANNCYDVMDSVKSIGVKIEAARSGKINRNYVFYTPKAMDEGMVSFLHPFPKHLQSKHNGEAVGPITEAEHILEFFPKASKEFLSIISRIEEHSLNSNGKELVAAVKDLVNSKEYKLSDYKGLGIANIYGDIHDPDLIYKMRDRERNKGTVSIGGKSKEVYCSICSGRVSPSHEHLRGEYYGGEQCFYINNDLKLDHCGFVTKPADIHTNTEIVRDEEDEQLKLDIISFTVKDSTENLMKLEELKQEVKDLDSIKKVIKDHIKDEADALNAIAHYEKNLKGSRPEHHLFTTDKLLNLRTPVGIYLAEKMLTLLDEGTDKEYLTEVLDNAKLRLKIENPEESLTTLLSGMKEKTTETTTTPENKTDKTEQAPSEGTSAETTEVKDGLNSYNDLIVSITELFEEKLADLKKAFVEVKDEEDKSFLARELKTLRNTLAADEEVMESLKKDYSTSLKEQIVALKGGTVSEDYQLKLDLRTIEELKLTLEDLKETHKVQTAQVEATNDLAAITPTDAVTKVEDSFKEEPDTEEKDQTKTSTTTEEEKQVTPETSEVQVQDNEQDTQPQDKEAWLNQRINEVGLARASKEFKQKFKK